MARAYLGIDIGTSAVKALLLRADGSEAGLGTAPHAFTRHQGGRAEQEPHSWLGGVRAAVSAALAATDADIQVEAIGVTGQMHGLVMLDEEMETLGPAILWPDRRSTEQVAALHGQFGGKLLQRSGGPVATGFLLPGLLWVRQHQPQRFAALHRVLLPKDFVRLWLTGKAATDPTDAASTGAFHVQASEWDSDLLQHLDLAPGLLPDVLPSQAQAGRLQSKPAASIGLPAGVPVVTGAGDLQAAVLGAGAVDTGTAFAQLGSGGQVLQPVNRYQVDAAGRLYTLPSALGQGWLLTGTTLAAGLALTWSARLLGAAAAGDGTAEPDLGPLFTAAGALSPQEHLPIFVPRLLGRRYPPRAQASGGAVTGLTVRHGPAHLFRAAVEGVVMELLLKHEAVKELAGEPARLLAGGRLVAQPLVRRLLASATGLSVETSALPHASARGAALLALAAGEGNDPAEVARRRAPSWQLTEPHPPTRRALQSRLAFFRALAGDGP